MAWEGAVKRQFCAADIPGGSRVMYECGHTADLLGVTPMELLQISRTWQGEIQCDACSLPNWKRLNAQRPTFEAVLGKLKKFYSEQGANR